MIVQNIRYRLKPIDNQTTQIRQNMGCVRVYYNMLIDDYKSFLEGTYKLLRKDNKYRKDIKGLISQGRLTNTRTSSRTLTVPKHTIGLIKANVSKAKKYKRITEKEAKNKEGKEYLKDADSTALVNARRNYERAIQNMYNPNTQAKLPRYKRREQFPRTYTSNNIRSLKKDKIGYNESIKITKIGNTNYIKLPKIGLVEIKLHRKIEGIIKTATIIEESTGKFYVTLTYETPSKEPLPKTNLTTGIDLGLNNLITYSNGEIEANHRHLVSELSNLKKLQQKLSKQALRLKKEGRKLNECKNYQKNRQKIAKLHAHIANSRKDHLHKLSKQIVSRYDIICMEDLDIRGMIASESNQAKNINILDVGWGELIRYIKYKSLWYGKEFVQVGERFPSSKKCSTEGCEYINAILPLTTRKWICPQCGTIHDRDINAAINIEIEGLRLLSEAS